METIDPVPDPREASARLDAVADAQRAVRDRPWPIWLHVTNALMLCALAAVALIPSAMIATFVVLLLAIGLVTINFRAGRRMGTPFAVPSSRGFRVLVTLSALCVIGSLLARAADLTWGVIACAAGAALSYTLAAIVHDQSARR